MELGPCTDRLIMNIIKLQPYKQKNYKEVDINLRQILFFNYRVKPNLMEVRKKIKSFLALILFTHQHACQHVHVVFDILQVSQVNALLLMSLSDHDDQKNDV